MRLVFGLVLIIGLALAGSAVYLARQYMGGVNTASQAEIERLRQRVEAVNIYVAKIPLTYGHVLTPEDVVQIKFPKESQPEGVFLTEDELFKASGPRTVLRAMEVNEPILAVKLTEPGGVAGIQTLLTPGMRAFSVPVNGSSAVGGFLFPGTRADISWSGTLTDQKTDGSSQERSINTVLLENVLILAVNQSANQDDRTPISDPRTITVEVNVEQQQLLQEARRRGDLTFAALGVAEAAGLGNRPITSVELDFFEKAADENCVTTRKGDETVTICN